MKKGIIVTTVALIAALSIATASSAATYLSIATGGTSGTYYAVGGALASAVTKGGKIQCTAETGNASVANANLIATKGIEIAFVQNDITHWAYNGELMFQGKPLKNIRTVASLYPENVQVVVAKDAGIKSISDLKGKRVGVGAPGSGVEGDVQAIFKLAGLTYKDLKKADFLDFAAVTSRFKDNQIDAGFVVAGFPTASIMDLTTTKDVDLLNFDDAFLAKLHKAYPFFVPSTIPAKTYKGIDKDTKTPAVMAILITNDSVPADQIYDFLTAMFDNLKDIAAVHAKGKEITLKGALDGLTAPLHPGAEKFYKEKGLIK
ncbi:MAG: TAXI family TRAP transporter solute-binding subunit [Synergistes jonesii]|uniref:TAXI family TRAP transporter solute-binding subunit n=1 Tax=Synergistes jonesii TaxID=2754 RepID=UPI002A755C3D|nr:TAXI family TRAP transporter solute-binding subunit [Synergistes jonesii]MDY2985125.1 TAXI family TRAP transporter solute-binding subunit [Synergistes jonesii]